MDTFLDERSRAIWTGRPATPEPSAGASRTREAMARATETPGHAAPPISDRRIAAVTWIVSKFGRPERSVDDGSLAGLLEVNRRTVERWRQDPEQLLAALCLRPDDFLERFVCALAVRREILPRLPDTMVMRAGKLEVRGPADTLASLESWVTAPEIAAIGVDVRVWRGAVRMTIEGSRLHVLAVRRALMKVERCLTLTPTAADVDDWIAGAPC